MQPAVQVPFFASINPCHRVQDLLSDSAAIGLRPVSVKYSRASFLFPEQQPPLYRCFDGEAAHLQSVLGPFGLCGTAQVLGNPECGLQWHTYTACRSGCSVAEQGWPEDSGESTDTSVYDVCTSDADSKLEGAESMTEDIAEQATGQRDASLTPQFEKAFGDDKALPDVQTLEVCMTGLSRAAAAQFERTDAFVSSKHTTETTGIRALAGEAIIDDYLFEPCGCAAASLHTDMLHQAKSLLVSMRQFSPVVHRHHTVASL